MTRRISGWSPSGSSVRRTQPRSAAHRRTERASRGEVSRASRSSRGSFTFRIQGDSRVEGMAVLKRSLVGVVAIVTLIGFPPLSAQRQRPLTPLPSDGLRVAPFFDGWYENPDGTIALSFGYSNLNKNQLVEIPLGPDNFIQPKEYDG